MTRWSASRRLPRDANVDRDDATCTNQQRLLDKHWFVGADLVDQADDPAFTVTVSVERVEVEGFEPPAFASASAVLTCASSSTKTCWSFARSQASE